MTQVSPTFVGRSPVLLPSREAPYELRGVYERVADGCREMLVLEWNDGHLSFRAEEDTDTLEVQLHETGFIPTPSDRSLGSAAPWAGFIGKECGWTWLAVNQQGYCDGAMLSFEGIIPGVLLHVIASSIEVFNITRG